MWRLSLQVFPLNNFPSSNCLFIYCLFIYIFHHKFIFHISFLQMKMGLKWVVSVVLFWGLCDLEASRWDERWRPSTCQDSRTRSLRQRPQCDETQLAPKNKKEKKILPVWYLLQHASTSSASRRVSVIFLLTGVASDALAQLWAFGENDIPPASFCCLEVRWGWQAFFFFF